MMIKLAVVSALLLAMPFEAVAAKVKAKFVDQDKKVHYEVGVQIGGEEFSQGILRQGQQEG